MSRLGCLVLGLLGLALAGCPTGPSDPPPPPSKPEIPQAPPRALGALAGGTDAAPRPDRTPGPEVEAAPSLPGLPPGHGKVAPPVGGGGAGSGGAAPAPAEPDAGVAL